MKIFCVLSALVLAASAVGPYEGHKVLSARPHTPEQVEALFGMEREGIFVDFWEASGQLEEDSVLRVTKEDAAKVQFLLQEAGLTVNVMHENAQKLVDDETDLNNKIAAEKPYVPGQLRSYDFGQYHRLADIHDFMHTLVADPAVAEIAEVFNMGMSTENRELLTIKIGKPTGAAKPAFYLHCNTHAREWITAGSCVWQINEIVTQYLAGNPDFVPYVEEMDWYIMPVHNPDGYEYTHTTSRYWRKTRSGPYGNIFPAYGVDPNRNWDSRWGGVGASGQPNSDTYHGPAPFSEPETKTVSDFILEHQDTIKAFVECHSYSQLWLIPYSYARNTQPEDGAELNAMAAESVAAIKATHGEDYRPGTAADILYSTTGGSHDWAKENAGVKWCFVPESRPKNAFGLAGFNPNPNQIVPNAEELLAGYLVIADRMIADAKANK